MPPSSDLSEPSTQTPAAAGAAVIAFPDRPQDRLRRALHKLEAALVEQGQAVAGFKASMSHLSVAVVGLDTSLTSYRAALEGAADAAHRANDAAIVLKTRAAQMASRR